MSLMCFGSCLETFRGSNLSHPPVSATAVLGALLINNVPSPSSPRHSETLDMLGHHLSSSQRVFSLCSGIVSHCMLDGLSAPPRAKGTMWSTS